MISTDLARMDNNAIATLGGANDALERLGAWVNAASQAHRLVAGLVDTAFIPDSYRVKVDPRATPEQHAAAREIAIGNATAAVLQGVTLGIDPLMALQQIYIVHGRPGMYAKMMVALVQAHGHEVWTEEGECSDTRAVVYGRRNGSQKVERVIITMDMARKAGWTSNAAYSKTPADMLWARAAGRVCDRIASNVLKGIASVEEIRDTIQVNAEVGDGTRTVKPRGRAALAAVPPPAAVAPDGDPPLDDDAHAAAAEQADNDPDDPPFEPDRPAEPLITAPQQKKLHTLLGKTGRGDREVALVWISGVVGREITTTKELSKREAVTVIDTLEMASQEPPLDEDDSWPPVAGAGESA